MQKSGRFNRGHSQGFFELFEACIDSLVVIVERKKHLMTPVQVVESEIKIIDTILDRGKYSQLTIASLWLIRAFYKKILEQKAKLTSSQHVKIVGMIATNKVLEEIYSVSIKLLKENGKAEE